MCVRFGFLFINFSKQIIRFLLPHICVYVLVLLCCIFFGNESKRDSVKGDSLRVHDHGIFGQMFEKKAKSFYSTFKSFLVGLPKRSIREAMFEVNGCLKLRHFNFSWPGSPPRCP